MVYIKFLAGPARAGGARGAWHQGGILQRGGKNTKKVLFFFQLPSVFPDDGLEARNIY